MLQQRQPRQERIRAEAFVDNSIAGVGGMYVCMYVFSCLGCLCCSIKPPPTESGGTVLAAICWATSAQRRCHPQEAL
jgi:hypothetical protein